MALPFRLEKDITFEAAHHLPLHDGKCKRVHGHSWKGTIVVEGKTLIKSGAKSGMLQDYGDIKAAVQHLLDGYLDHHDLNVTTGLTNPTSEELAQWIYQMLKPKLSMLAEVIVEETCSARCIYRPFQG